VVTSCPVCSGHLTMANVLTITASALAEKGIDVATWSALKNSIYPGAKDESVMMALDYCRARQLDPLLKPVHLVPMSVKDSRTGKSEWRDVVMVLPHCHSMSMNMKMRFVQL